MESTKRLTFKIALLSKKTKEVVEMRKFSFPAGPITIEQLYGAFDRTGTLMYTDNSGDVISLRTQLDLEEMLRESPRDADGNLRLLAYRVGAIEQMRDTARPVLQRVSSEAKRAAEEAIVLGVRAYTSVVGDTGVKEVKEEQQPVPVEIKVEATQEQQQQQPQEQQQQVVVDETQQQVEQLQQQAQSFAERLRDGVQQMAEEMLVLGVRAGSYIESKLTSSGKYIEEEQDSACNNNEADDTDNNSNNNNNNNNCNNGNDSCVENVRAVESEPVVSIVAGPAVPNAAPAPPLSFDMERKLADLKDMGFLDEALNRTVLIRCDGDVIRSVEELLQH